MSCSIAFVILHYNAIKETMDCVESIVKNIDTDDYKIVIVDNASPNGSGKYLADKYENDSKIRVILNRNNDGFAKGNNIGYQYAKNDFGCEFMCVTNNDTLLEQLDFYSKIKDEYDRSKFGVLGPRIILKNGNDNPLYVKFPSKKFLEDELRLQKRTLFYMKYHLDHIVVAFKLFINMIYKTLGKKKKSRYREYMSYKGTDKRHENIVLHGCCLVFSPRYIEQYDDAFNPNTFVYREEELLYLRCKRKELGMVYSPELRITHLEDVSTNSMLKGKRDKFKFQLENQISSLKILIDEIEE